MLIHNISPDEVKKFIATLTTVETKYYDIKKEKHLEYALLVNGYEDNGELVGVGGIDKYYNLIPHTFYMIKYKYQGMGIGTMMAKENMQFAAKRFPFIITIIEDGNIKARNIAERQGFKFAIRRGTHIYYLKHFNFLGKCIGWLFPYIIQVYYFVAKRR